MVEDGGGWWRITEDECRFTLGNSMNTLRHDEKKWASPGIYLIS
jgi:hypothetical protein